MIINQGQPTAYDIVFPVFGGNFDKNGNFIPQDIFGTAFYINNDFFVTCGHTIKNALECGAIALGYQNEEKNMSFAKVTDQEVFEENDSGIIRSSISRAKAYPWLFEKLAMLNNVVSSGYPYAFDKHNNEISIRSFKGYIVSVGRWNEFQSKPEDYELSYPCPRGISGAPLLFVHRGTQTYVCGMTFNNKITEMIVSSFKEVTEDEKERIIHESTERFHTGVAVQTHSFFNLKSRLLSETFFDYLKKEHLLDLNI